MAGGTLLLRPEGWETAGTAGVQALNAYPTNGELLLVTALAALIEERPDQSLRYQKRFQQALYVGHRTAFAAGIDVGSAKPLGSG
jgi:hypothetical protein